MEKTLKAFDITFIGAVIALIACFIPLWLGPNQITFSNLLKAIATIIVVLIVLIILKFCYGFESDIFNFGPEKPVPHLQENNDNQESSVEDVVEIIDNPDSIEDNYNDEYSDHDETLKEAASFAESGDYASAIALIKKAQETNGEDEDYTNAYNTYCASYKAEVIILTDELSGNGDYLGAIQKIAEATAVIGEDSDLSSRATLYEDSYVSTTVIKIDEYLEAKDFSSAERTITTALAAFPANQTLLAEKELIKNAMPQSLLAVCPPYRTENYEEWAHLSMGGTKYPAGVSIGRTGTWGGEGYALFNLSGKFRLLAFDVGNIDERGSATDQALYIYLDDRLVWSLELEPEALPTHYEVDVSGANQMKMVGTTWAGDFGITNIVITGSTQPIETNVVSFDDGDDLLTVCPPYKTDNYEEWSHLSIAGTKYASGISVGRTGTWGGEGYALFNLSGKYTTLSFDVGNIDDRGTASDETLYIYLDNKLVWSLDLDPQALPTHYVVDVSGVNQLKILGSTWAGDFGVFNLKIK